MPKVTSQKNNKVVANKQAEKPKKVYCMNCGSGNQENFYRSNNPLNKFFNKIPYCKDCIKNDMWNYYIKKYNNNEQLALHGLLRSLNLPYIHSIYIGSLKTVNNPTSTIKTGEIDEDGNKKNSNALISAYMKIYNSMYERNGYGDTYLDSEGLGEISGVAVYEDNINIKRKRKPEDLENINTDKYEILEYDAEELIYKWGEFEDEKLIKLELEWLDWSDKIGDFINDKSTDLLVKQVCQQTVDIQEKRERGEKVKDEVAALQGLLNTSGLIEKTREKNSETVKIGQTIREIENARPIKETIPELVDVDKYGDLIDTFTGAMCRTLGKENYFTKRFDELYKDYTIDLNAFAELSPDKKDDGNGE